MYLMSIFKILTFNDGQKCKLKLFGNKGKQNRKYLLASKRKYNVHMC